MDDPGLAVDAFSQEGAYCVYIHIKNDLKMKPVKSRGLNQDDITIPR
jgi:hypothetical protein